MAAFQSRDPALAARLMNLVESGLSADEVARQLVEDNVQRALAKTEGSGTFAEDTEVFADEIKVIAQALAYRSAGEEDMAEVAQLLNAAYMPEISGPKHPECFRLGIDSDGGGGGGSESVAVESVEALFRDPTYSWQLVEAPSGRDVERDGVILGACCYSTDGVSRKNGQVEGNLGSVRFFGVLPRFHGVCVGRRLLHRVELLMSQAGCVRSMICVPSTRASLIAWLERRGYLQAGATPYPFASLGHEPLLSTPDDRLPRIEAQLLVFVKALGGTSEEAQGKTVKSTVLSMAATATAAAAVAAATVEDEDADERSPSEGGAGTRKGLDPNDGPLLSPLPHVPGKMHLPPHWRGYSEEDIKAVAALPDSKGGVARRAAAPEGDDELGVD